MLASISRIAARQARGKLAPSAKSNSAPQTRTGASKSLLWRSKVIRKYTSEREAALRAAGVPEEGYATGIDVDKIAASITADMPSEEALRKFAQDYAEHAGDSAVAPPSVSTDEETIQYNKILRAHAARNEYDILLLKFLQFHQRRVVPDCNTFAIVIDEIATRGHFNLFAPIDELLKQIRIVKTLELTNSIMRLCALSGNSQRASYAFKEMMTESRIAPSIRTVEHYMIAHAKTPGHFHIVMECFKQYPQKWNLKLDADFHGAFIRALFLNDKEAIALKRWEAMETGKLPAPTNSAIQVMLDHYASKSNLDALTALYADINAKYGLYPSKENNATYLEALMKLEKSDEALSIIERQCAEGWLVEPRTMFKLMNVFSEQGKRAIVERLWAMCPKVGVEPNQHALFHIVSACCRDRKPDRALAYMSIAEDKYKVAPSRQIYAVLISSFGAERDLSKCLTLYRRMALVDRILPGPTTFITLISAYARNNEFEAILRMLKNPASHGIPKENRHFFSDAIEALENAEDQPLASLIGFDWTRLQGVTSETHQDLVELTKSLNM